MPKSLGQVQHHLMPLRRSGAADDKDYDAMTTNDMHSALPRTPTPKTSAPRPTRRLVTDFLFALFLFNLAACALMPRSVDAFAATPHDTHNSKANASSAAGLMTTGYGVPDGHGERVHGSSPQHFASLLSGGHDRAGRPLPGPVGLILLSLVFAALTAFNLQLVRHLREAYVPATHKRRSR